MNITFKACAIAISLISPYAFAEVVQFTGVPTTIFADGTISTSLTSFGTGGFNSISGYNNLDAFNGFGVNDLSILFTNPVEFNSLDIADYSNTNNVNIILLNSSGQVISQTDINVTNTDCPTTSCSGSLIYNAYNPVVFNTNNVSQVIFQYAADISANLAYFILSNVTYTPSTIVNGGSETISGTVTNNATQTLSASNLTTTLLLSGDTRLSGSGSTVMSNSSNNYIDSSSSAIATLTIGSGYTVSGGGNLGNYTNGLKVVNQGTVLANASSGMIISVNDGSGSLGFDNSAGLIQVGNGSLLNLARGTIDGGSINALGNSGLTGAGTFANLVLNGGFNLSGAATFNNVTFNNNNTLSSGSASLNGSTTENGLLTINNGGSLYTADTITNNSTLSLNATTAATSIFLTGNTTFAGSGSTVMGNSSNNYIDSSTSTIATLTIGNGYTISGGGNLGSNANGLKVVNNGTLLADATNGMTIAVTDNGGSPGFNNSAGLIQVGNSSTLNLARGVISGGAVRALGNSRLAGTGTFANLSLYGGFNLSGGATYNNVTFNNNNTLTSGNASFSGATTLNGLFTVDNGGILYTQGAISNNSILSLNASNISTSLLLAGDTTFSGSGSTVMSNSSNNYIDSSSGTITTLTIANGYTISGGGNLGNISNGLKVVNQGMVLANAPGGMTISVNDSNGSPGFNNSTGLIQVANDSALNLTQGTISGGSIQSLGNSTLEGSGAFANLVLNGGFNLLGSTIYNAVTFDNSNTLNTGSASFLGNITNNGAFILAGDYSLNDSGFSSGVFVNDGILAKTSGTGTSAVSGGNLSFVNSSTGIIEAQSGNLQLPGNFTNQGNITGTSTVTTSQLTNSGHVTPGVYDGVTGALTLNGNYVQTSSGTLEIGISSANHNSILDINGNAVWGGSLKIDDQGNFTPVVGESFTLASISGTASGNFLSIDTSAFQYVTFETLYQSNEVQLLVTAVTTVPIPAPFWLTGSALVGFIGLTRRKFNRNVVR